MNLFDPLFSVTDFKSLVLSPSLSVADCERVLNFTYLLINSVVPINLDNSKVFKETVKPSLYQNHNLQFNTFRVVSSVNLKRPVTEMISPVSFTKGSNQIHEVIENEVIEYKSYLEEDQKPILQEILILLYTMHGSNPPNFNNSSNMKKYEADSTKIEYFGNPTQKAYLDDNSAILDLINLIFTISKSSIA